MKKYLLKAAAAILIILPLMMNSCKKANIKETTTTDVNLLEYLQNDSLQRFTDLVSIVNKAGYDAFMNAYGTYTMFAPTNSAIKAYLTKIGKPSIDQLQPDELKDLLRFHLLEEVVRTSDFNDGKLSALTMYGQYLVTGVSNTDGTSAFTVNRQAIITQPNIVVGNGIIQVIDNVLTPTVKSLAKQAEANADYTLFTQALKATGYYNLLDSNINADKSPRWLTLIAETNKALQDTGITTLDQLTTRYNTVAGHTSDLKDPLNGLNRYVAYHILKEVKYLADIVMSGSHETLVPLEVVTDKVINKKLYLNDDEYTTINGNVHEAGVELEQSTSDISATNGVLHRAVKHLAIKERSPFPVYWDLCATQPELTRLGNVYRKKTYLFDFNDGNAFKDIKWEQSCLKYRNGVQGYLGDYWQMGLGTSSSNTESLGTCAKNSWIEFTTPLLVKGKYKVWFCYYTQNSTTSAVQGSFDSIPLTSSLIAFNQKISSVDFAQEAALAAIGWKWWAGSAKKAGSTVGRMLGIVDVKATGRHKIRFDLISGTNADCNFDMVHFIPLDMDQTIQRFNPDGTTETYRP